MEWNNLSGPQTLVLSTAIQHAYPTRPDFDQFLFTKLNEAKMENKVAIDGYEIMLVGYLKRFVIAGGWADRLVAAVQRDKPNNVLFRNLPRTIRLAGAEAPERISGPEVEFEAIAQGGGFADILPWLQTMATISEATCRIESPSGNALGTGMLVGPDLVLTNQHVAKLWTDDATAVCRFGYANDVSGKREGTEVTLSVEGARVASSVDGEGAPDDERLDYALLRLGSPPKGVKAISVRAETTAQIDAPALIVQHPKGDPQALSIGRFRKDAGATWQYDADTLEGSSGSGVFNQKLELVALHQGAKAGAAEAAYNQGISIDKIIASLRAKKAKKVEKFW